MSDKEIIENETQPAEEAPVEEQLTPEQIAGLKEQAAKAQENHERLMRTAADLENYKKRAARERHGTTRSPQTGAANARITSPHYSSSEEKACTVSSDE